MFILLEIRKYGERIAMHRVARHALWAASVVVVLQSIVAAVAMIRRSGLDFVVIDYALVMTLTGTLVYLWAACSKNLRSRRLRARRGVNEHRLASS